jgi:5,10-methylenetetrahydrofolate reductase
MSVSLPSSRYERAVPLYLEAVPPELSRGAAGVDAVLEKIEALQGNVGLDGVNIPEIREESSKSERGERIKPFEPRMEPRELAALVRETFGVECMINRVVVHMERERQADWFRQTWEEYGIRQFVLVGGEKSGIDYPGPSVPEANELIRRVVRDPGLRVGNICIPTRRGEAERMRRKMAAGVDFFTTQIIYHAAEFTGLLDQLGEPPAGGRAPTLLLTLCPVRSARNIRFLHWLGVSISRDLEAWLVENPDQVTERALEQIEVTWAEICQYLAERGERFPVGVSIAPIGKVPHATSIRLARELVRNCTALA